LLGHHPLKITCAKCGKEYSLDYDPADLKRVSDWAGRIISAAQTAVNNSHPEGHPSYINLYEI
jgi:hypothetical protein